MRSSLIWVCTVCSDLSVPIFKIITVNQSTLLCRFFFFSLGSNVRHQFVKYWWDYKYLSWVYGVDRKICHEGHWSALRGLPYTHNRYFFLHIFWFTTFDFQSRTCYKVTHFPLQSFYLSLKKSKQPATTVCFFTLTSYLYKVTSFYDIMAVKTNVTSRRWYLTSYTTNALNTCDFYPVLGEITWVR